jgi:hypothetical protein
MTELRTEKKGDDAYVEGRAYVPSSHVRRVPVHLATARQSASDMGAPRFFLIGSVVAAQTILAGA